MSLMIEIAQRAATVMPRPRVTLFILAGLLTVACHRDALPDTSAMPAPEPVAVPAVPGDATAPPQPAPATPASDGGNSDRRRIQLMPGQSIALAPDAVLRLERLVSDSRCPAGAQCIWAGEVRIALSLQSGTDRRDFELATASEPEARIAGWEIRLEAYADCPKEHLAPAGSACAVLSVATAPP